MSATPMQLDALIAAGNFATDDQISEIITTWESCGIPPSWITDPFAAMSLAVRIVMLKRQALTAAPEAGTEEAVSVARYRAFDMAIKRIEQFGATEALEYMRRQRDHYTAPPAIDREKVAKVLQRAYEKWHTKITNKEEVSANPWLFEADAILAHLTGGGE